MTTHMANTLPGAAPLDTAEPTFAEGRTGIGSYRTYQEAQAVVDRLSDVGFDVENVRILGHGLTSVEQVTGRQTVGRAALTAAGGGAWFGFLIALLLGIFLPAPAWLSLILAGLLFGALWGALFGAVGQWATRGRRDFTSASSLAAATYEVLVSSDRAAEARRVLAAQAA